METNDRTIPGLSRPALGLLACAGALVLSSCGGGGSYDNKLRPAAPINITAYVSTKAVSVSPAKFGAGPIVLIVTNQSDNAQELTLETDQLASSTPGVKQSTGPISPRGTGRLKVDVKSGSYTLHTGSDTIQPAKLTVGSARPSAQNQVLQP
jgi:hypothetical protein